MDDEWPRYDDEDAIVFPASFGLKAVLRPSGIFFRRDDEPRPACDDDKDMEMKG